MVHPEKYGHAHRRLWKDAELLSENSRWANADHFFGLSAECGLKALMPNLGMTVRYKHVDEIWSQFAEMATSASGRVDARYLALLPGGTPFLDWSVNNRYAHSKHFPRSVVEPHRKAASDVCRMVNVAEQDGIQFE